MAYLILSTKLKVGNQVMKANFYLTIIAILLGVIVFLECRNPKDTVPLPKPEVITDTLTFTDTLYFPSVPETLKISVPVPIPGPEIGQNQYWKTFSGKEISGSLYALTQGELLDWNVSYIANRQIITNTKLIFRDHYIPTPVPALSRNFIILGGGFSLSQNPYYLLSAGIGYKKFVYQYTYSPMTSAHGFMISYKIEM